MISKKVFVGATLAMALLLFGVTVPATSDDADFGPHVTYGAGTNPRDVAVGDLDGDDDLDLVTANWGGNVSVLMNVHHTPLHILQLQPMHDARVGFGAAMGIDGKIYVFGGAGPSDHLSTVECYDPAIDTWSYRAPMPGARNYLRAATAPDGRIFTFGGSTNGFPSTEVWAYDPASDTWDTSVPQMPTARRDVVAVTGSDGIIYVFGGHNNYDTVEAFDPVNEIWYTKASVPTGRWWAGGALGPDGKIYIVGGGISGYVDGALDSLEVYNPAPDSWETRSPMPAKSSALGAAFGPDGKLYAIGGEIYAPARTGVVYDLIQRYDPLTDTWDIAGNLPVGLSGLSAIANSGGIYILGGGYLDGDQIIPTNWNQYLLLGSVVRIDPPEKSVYPNSEPFTITVAISNVVDLAGFQFTMTFSSTVVHVEDAVLGDFLESTGRTASPIGPDTDNVAGTMTFGAYSVGTEPGAEGSGVLAMLTLTPQASGESDLHLQNVQVGNTVPEAIPVSTQDGHVRVCIFGDFNCDCKVNIVDIMLVAIRWNTFVGDPDYDPTYDLDGDGDIDIMDILLVAVHWGETCE
jgi:N-acetylneuraminic acid mutarotase